MSADSNRGMRVERLFARIGALALAVGFVGALLALDVALAPPTAAQKNAASCAAGDDTGRCCEPVGEQPG